MNDGKVERKMENRSEYEFFSMKCVTENNEFSV